MKAKHTEHIWDISQLSKKECVDELYSESEKKLFILTHVKASPLPFRPNSPTTYNNRYRLHMFCKKPVLFQGVLHWCWSLVFQTAPLQEFYVGLLFHSHLTNILRELLYYYLYHLSNEWFLFIMLFRYKLYIGFINSADVLPASIWPQYYFCAVLTRCIWLHYSRF